jgi:hypothetical protein
MTRTGGITGRVLSLASVNARCYAHRVGLRSHESDQLLMLTIRTALRELLHDKVSAECPLTRRNRLGRRSNYPGERTSA